MAFTKQNTQPNFAELEERVNKYWEEQKTFQKSVAQRKGGESWHFYDGPPFISGMPHYGHIKDFVVKDAVPRYFTMKGKYAPRIWGWDCHGLPIENKVEKKLGLKSKLEVEEFGIEKYIEECYNYTRSTSDEWPWYVRKMGRWIDYDHAYRTMDQNYMETVWWVFKNLKEKGLIYKGWRSSLYSTDSATPVSNFEIAMDNTYEEVEDHAITTKFLLDQNEAWQKFVEKSGISETEAKKISDREVFMLSWTTTPWTIPSNFALAVNPEEDYVLVETPDDHATYTGRWLFTEKPFDYNKADKEKQEKFILSLRGENLAAESNDEITSQAKLLGADLSDLPELEISVVKKGKKFYFDLDGSLLEIEQQMYQQLSKLSPHPAIRKTRYYYPLKEDPGSESRAVLYIDEYEGPQTALNSIEVEFTTPVHYISFKENLPKWFGTDITYKTDNFTADLLAGTEEELLAKLLAKEDKPIKLDKESYYQYAILAAKLAEEVLGEYRIVASFKGAELEGLSYAQIYNYLAAGSNDHQIYLYDGVTVTEGTGVLHIAPAFGEEDFNLGQKHNLSFKQCIDDAGNLLPETEQFAGMYLRDAALPISNDLKKRNRLYSQERYTHRLPFYRYENPLIYRAQDSWFVDVQTLKPDLQQANEDINWIPKHLQHGRFGKGIETAPDWSISRNRYWSTAMPVWVKDNSASTGEEADQENRRDYDMAADKIDKDREKDEHIVIGSRAELRSKAVQEITQLNFFHTSDWDKDVTASLEQILAGIDNELTGLADIDKVIVSTADNSYAQKISQAVAPAENSANDIAVERSEGIDATSLINANPGKNLLVITDTAAVAQTKSKFENKDLEECMAGLGKGVGEVGFYSMFFMDGALLDLHRPVIDKVTLKDSAGNTYSRLPEVLDVWMDSGSMPYAQLHYPFENKDVLENNYPADFIVEYIAQTRAWFYVTHVLGVALTGKEAFKNVVTSGVIFGTDGRKMSKTYGNYPDPKGTLEKYGAEAMRWYFLNSKLIMGEDVNFDEKSLRDQLRMYILPLWNSFSFFCTYAEIHNWQPDNDLVSNKTNSKIRTVFSVEGGERNDTYWYKVPFTPKNKLDIWIVAVLQKLSHEVRAEFDQYHIPKGTRMLEEFVNTLSKGYIRRSRERFASGDNEAFATLYYVLVEFSKLTAPFTPFVAEAMYQELVSGQFKGEEGIPESVHLSDYPQADMDYLEKNAIVMKKMEAVAEIVSLGQRLRTQAGLKIRQPLAEIEIQIVLNHARDKELEEWMSEIITSELNIKSAREVITPAEKDGWLFAKSSEAEISVNLDTEISGELRREGQLRELARQIQMRRKKIGLEIGDNIRLELIGDRSILAGLETLEVELANNVNASDVIYTEQKQIDKSYLEDATKLKLSEEDYIYIKLAKS